MTTFKKVKAIRYKMITATETQMKEKVRYVKKTVMKNVTEDIKVPVYPTNRSSPCSCANDPITVESKARSAFGSGCNCEPTMNFETKTITKFMPQTIEVAETYEEPCEVEVQKKVPYEVEVNEPVVSFETVTEDYKVNIPQKKMIDFTITEKIPVVTRTCTDAHGTVINQEEID